MPASPSVLIVDPSADTREVLRTLLDGRGLMALTASGAREGVDLAQRHQPDCIVYDVACEPLPVEWADGETRIVVLGKLRRQSEGRAGREFVAKPYHYGPLIRKIESFLNEARRSLGD
ncbi:MAG: hypothetical protein JNM18_01640 [Planctomycetaceae bacterium]|nr:hypothetical protein [Planctomycetaceae bacterium]